MKAGISLLVSNSEADKEGVGSLTALKGFSESGICLSTPRLLSLPPPLQPDLLIFPKGNSFYSVTFPSFECQAGMVLIRLVHSERCLA